MPDDDRVILSPLDRQLAVALVRADARTGFTVVRALPELEGRFWDAIAEAYLRALRPSSVRVIRPGEAETSDARSWRVTVLLTASGHVARIEQEVEVDLPPGVEHGHHLGELLRGAVPPEPRRCEWLVAGMGETRCELSANHPGPCRAPEKADRLRAAFAKAGKP